MTLWQIANISWKWFIFTEIEVSRKPVVVVVVVRFNLFFSSVFVCVFVYVLASISSLAEWCSDFWISSLAKIVVSVIPKFVVLAENFPSSHNYFECKWEVYQSIKNINSSLLDVQVLFKSKVVKTNFEGGQKND